MVDVSEGKNYAFDFSEYDEASYYSKMRQLAAAADYHNMTADDYLAFRPTSPTAR